MRRLFQVAGAILVAFVLSVTVAAADDWVAVKLRGKVLQLIGDEWVELSRNDVVSDDRAIRTTLSGRVTFQRDAETIELGPNTQIRIHDRTGQRFTVVEEHFGTINVEAEVQNVQHFAVETPFLAAVVKGTRFTVKTGPHGGSVSVARGAVAVAALVDGSRTTVMAGQTATVNAIGFGIEDIGGGDPALEVSGNGDLPEVIFADTEDALDVVGDTAGELLDELIGNLGGKRIGKGSGGGSGSEGGGGIGGSGGGGGSGGSGNGGGSGGGGGGGSGGGGSGGLVGGLLRRIL